MTQNTVLKNQDISINLKTNVFNTCILSLMTYGMETIPLTIKAADKLYTIQGTIERTMIGVGLEDRYRNKPVSQKTM